MGIRKAKGYIIGMFCADNMIMDRNLFQTVKNQFDFHLDCSAVYPRRYHYRKDDHSLNRYFSLIGGNDPVCYYLGKNDREPHVSSLKRVSNYAPSYGCNGFFYRADLIKKTNLDHYYPMDNALEVPGKFIGLPFDSVWHRTSDNLLTFMKKRYKYARDLYCDRRDRRWKMLDTREDYWKLLFFILSTVCVVPPIFLSFKGYSKVRDRAWFWHPVVCWAFLITYGVLTLRCLWVQLSYQVLAVVRCSEIVWNLSGRRRTKTSKSLQ